jgi:hypothetical protein
MKANITLMEKMFTEKAQFLQYTNEWWWLYLYIRFDILTSVKMSMLVFWAAMPYGLYSVTAQKTNIDN